VLEIGRIALIKLPKLMKSSRLLGILFHNQNKKMMVRIKKANQRRKKKIKEIYMMDKFKRIKFNNSLNPLSK
jgi:hypothetical protein